MRVAGDNSEFIFDSPYWTNRETFGNIDDPSPDPGPDVKYPSFLHTNVEEIRGCLSGMTEEDCKAYTVSQLHGMGDYSSIQAIFSSVPVGTDDIAMVFDESQEEMMGWLSINGLSCHDTSTCNWHAAGINLADTTGDQEHGSCNHGGTTTCGGFECYNTDQNADGLCDESAS